MGGEGGSRWRRRRRGWAWRFLEGTSPMGTDDYYVVVLVVCPVSKRVLDGWLK